MTIGVKKFFRFLRGELNGFYLKRLAYFVNKWIDLNINPIFCYMSNLQFSLDYDSISEDDIFNLAKFAGITQILAQGTLLTNVLLMTTSEKRDLENPCFSATGEELDITFQRQISERGLYNVPNESFDFRFWNRRSKDITDNATDKMQATLVPDERQPKGYIKEGGIIYDKEGTYTGKDVLPNPPTDGTPYTDYYGQEFLQLGEEYLVFRAIPKEILYNIVLIIQRIRYNGSSVKTFAELTSLIVGDESGINQGFVKLHSHIFTPSTPLFVTWKYVIDEEKPVDNRIVRLEAWKTLVENFFPQIVLVEISSVKNIKE